MTAICATCGKGCRLTDGVEIYPHLPNLAEKKIYVCDPCGARVGCHPGTDTPLGTAADSITRTARIATHTLLDPLWKNNKQIKRGDVYRYLARRMGMDQSKCHIGMFDAKQCYAANEILRGATADQIKQHAEAGNKS